MWKAFGKAFSLPEYPCLCGCIAFRHVRIINSQGRQEQKNRCENCRTICDFLPSREEVDAVRRKAGEVT